MKTLTVARHEFLTTLKRRSALFVIFGLPIISFLFLAGINWLASSQGDDSSAALSDFVLGEDAFQTQPVGLVDETGKISAETIGERPFRLLPDVDRAQELVSAGEIKGYYVVPADFLESGDVFYFAEESPSEFVDTGEEFMLFDLLATGFLAKAKVISTAEAERIVSPIINYTEIDLSAEADTPPGTEFGALALGFGIAILFYLTVVGASGYLLQGLGNEKQNRVMEILISSIRPFNLLVGKMLGLGAVGILQMIIWTVFALVIFGGGGNSMLASITLPTLSVGNWIIIVAFFVAGYLVYASLFAGLGAITPGPKESSQYTFFLMLPTFIPLWFGSVLITAPNGTLATTLSFVPVTASLAMPMRLILTSVPAWQWLLSLVISGVTAVLMLWLATKLFRSQALLSGQMLSPKVIWKGLRG